MPTPQHSSRLVAYPDLAESLRKLDDLPSPTQPPVSPGHSYYGPLGDTFMAARLQLSLEQCLHERGYTLSLNIPATVSQFDQLLPSSQSIVDPAQPPTSGGSTEATLELHRDSEERLMRPFWDFLCCIYPVILESDFMALYNTLWRPWSPQQGRRPCALTDSILALGAQHSVGTIVSEDQSSVLVPSSYHLVMSSDAKGMAHMAAGYYARGQQLLQADLEAPTLRTVQTCVLLAIYLSHASLFNFAYRMVGNGIDAARSLRLDTPPLANIGSPKEELHARIWATLWLLDARISQTTGRDPFLTENDDWKLLPRCDFSLAPGSDNSLYISLYSGISWVTFQHRLVSLMSKTRNIQDEFRNKCDELLQTQHCQNIFQSPLLLETLARFVQYKVQLDIEEWERELPRQLRIKRNYDEPYNVTDSMFTTNSQTSDTKVGEWLTYQRIHLEVAMHSQLMTLRRPFVKVSPERVHRAPPSTSTSSTHLADTMATLAVEHAAALSYVLFRTQTETKLFMAWPHLLQYQWDAFIVIIGFLLGENRCEKTFRRYARGALKTALCCLDVVSSISIVAQAMFEKAKELISIASDICGERLDRPDSDEGTINREPMVAVHPGPNPGPGQALPFVKANGFNAAVEASNLPFAPRNMPPSPLRMSPPNSPTMPPSAMPQASNLIRSAPPIMQSMTFGASHLLPNLEQSLSASTESSLSAPPRKGPFNRQQVPPMKQRKRAYGPELPPHMAEARACAAFECLHLTDEKTPGAGNFGQPALSDSRGSALSTRSTAEPPRRRRRTDWDRL